MKTDDMLNEILDLCSDPDEWVLYRVMNDPQWFTHTRYNLSLTKHNLCVREPFQLICHTYNVQSLMELHEHLYKRDRTVELSRILHTIKNPPKWWEFWK